MTGKPRALKRTFDRLMDIMSAEKIKGIVIGASALAAYGAPRYTADIDILTDDVSARKLVMALTRKGHDGPPPSRDVFMYIMTSPEGIEIDVMGAVEPIYREAIDNRKRRTLLGRKVPVPSEEFYVLLKLRAAESSPPDRLKHLADALRLIQVRPNTDMSFVESFVRLNERDLLGVLNELKKHKKMSET